MIAPSDLQIRRAEEQDADAVCGIARAIVSTGDTWVIAPNSTPKELYDYFFDKKKYLYVALLEEKIVGFFFITDNQKGLGSHIANAGYMVNPSIQAKGIGRTMGIRSFELAKELGYTAMQYNVVIKTNQRAVQLWQSLGFDIIGEIPDAFRHQTLGLVNAYIMYKKL